MFTEEQLQNVAREVLQEGVWDEGRELGMVMGFELAQKEIARNALTKEMSVEMINDVTGLDSEIIKELSNVESIPCAKEIMNLLAIKQNWTDENDFLHIKTYEEAREEGRKRALEEIARNAMIKGMSDEMINSITCISLESIKQEFETIKELWQEKGRRESYNEGFEKGMMKGMGTGKKIARDDILELLERDLPIEETKRRLKNYYKTTK